MVNLKVARLMYVKKYHFSRMRALMRNFNLKQAPE